MEQPSSIISELEEAVSSGSSAKRVSTLRQVTDLFLNDGERLSDEQVKVFDDVLCFLVARVETRARAELAKRLAPVDYAPFEVIQHLAFDDDIAVSGDVLTNSSRLGTETLVKIASTKSQDHLMAISARSNLPEVVTDVIVDRGESRVIRRLANNTSAKFSEGGYSGMVAHASRDDELTEILGLRLDLPVKFLRDLLRRAKDAVRDRLLAIAPQSVREEIQRVLAAIAREPNVPTRDFSAADAFFAPVAFRIRTYGLDVGGGQAWVDRVLAHPAMLEWEQAALAETWREAAHEEELAAAGVITADYRR